MKIMEEDGRPLSTIWVEMFTEDPFKAMKLAIDAQPKQHIHDGEIDHNMNTPAIPSDVLREAFKTRRVIEGRSNVVAIEDRRDDKV
jgi:hypothetical protein